MATKKQHKIIEATAQVEQGDDTSRKVKEARPVGNAKALRIWAVVLWVLGLAFEVFAVLIFIGKVNITAFSPLAQIIIALIIDLILVAIGSQCWKRANHIEPVSKANATKFWLWNNLGSIVAVIAFVPFILIALTDKNADKKTKTVASAVAVIALIIAGLAGFDWNPISSEELEAAKNTFGTQTVYWTTFGKVYHTHEDCQALNRSDTLYKGTVSQAVDSKDGGSKTRLCHFCAKRDDIKGVTTDQPDENEVEREEDETSGE